MGPRVFKSRDFTARVEALKGKDRVNLTIDLGPNDSITLKFTKQEAAIIGPLLTKAATIK